MEGVGATPRHGPASPAPPLAPARRTRELFSLDGTTRFFDPASTCRKRNCPDFRGVRAVLFPDVSGDPELKAPAKPGRRGMALHNPAKPERKPRKGETHASAEASSPAASDLIFSVDVLPGETLLEPRRESHENGFSSPAPSLNWRLCRQTMDPLSPPLRRRIPESPRT